MPMGVFLMPFVCNVGAHLSVKCVIGSWFNLHEKTRVECNQMGCVLLCAPHKAGSECLHGGQREQNYDCVCVCVSVCFSVSAPN